MKKRASRHGGFGGDRTRERKFRPDRTRLLCPVFLDRNAAICERRRQGGEMSETSTRSGQPRYSPAGAAAGEGNQPGRRKRRGMRIALISVGSVFALVAAIAVAGLVTFNHIASEI